MPWTFLWTLQASRILSWGPIMHHSCSKQIATQLPVPCRSSPHISADTCCSSGQRNSSLNSATLDADSIHCKCHVVVSQNHHIPNCGVLAEYFTSLCLVSQLNQSHITKKTWKHRKSVLGSSLSQHLCRDPFQSQQEKAKDWGNLLPRCLTSPWDGEIEIRFKWHPSCYHSSFKLVPNMDVSEVPSEGAVSHQKSQTWTPAQSNTPYL